MSEWGVFWLDEMQEWQKIHDRAIEEGSKMHSIIAVNVDKTKPVDFKKVLSIPSDIQPLYTFDQLRQLSDQMHAMVFSYNSFSTCKDMIDGFLD